MIKTKDLTKKYGNFIAVDHVNLNIPGGEIYGFLGPNGAGKTSTIMMLLGITEPTRGEIFLFGEKYKSSKLNLRKRIGVVPEKHPKGMWKWMTAREYLMFFGELFGLKGLSKRITYLLDQTGLLDAEYKKIHSFSRGMLQKLSISRALLHDPDILFLDEPISGLDPIGIKKVRDLILSENREGRTIFISSHLLSEMEKICHRVAIIYNGKLIAEDNMDNLFIKLRKEKEIIVELEKMPKGNLEYITSIVFLENEQIFVKKLESEFTSCEGDLEYKVGYEKRHRTNFIHKDNFPLYTANVRSTEWNKRDLMLVIFGGVISGALLLVIAYCYGIY